MHSTRFQILRGLGRLFFVLWLSGCSDVGPEPNQWPMRPLVYTENPDLTPESAAVNEGRLTRDLLRGARGAGWGAMQTKPADLPELDSLNALGRATFDALVKHDETLWDHVFVPVEAYAEMVHMDAGPAQVFVDGIQGRSRSLWDVFEPPNLSEARPNGWAGLFEFVEFVPGDGRRLDGKSANSDDEIAQYWNGRLTLRYVPGDTTFDLSVAKILRVAGEKDHYYLGSPIQVDSRLKVLIASGMHLKPELMRSGEYPYPLQVGSFWRYSRYPQGHEDDVVDPQVMATAVVVEVVSVDRYDTVRLIRPRLSYNETSLTKADEWWVATPRRIYVCDRGCRGHVQETSWMLAYFAAQAPIYAFPLQADQRWGAGGYNSGSPVFTTRAGQAMDLPGGVFPSTIEIRGQGALGAWDDHLALPQSRVFVWGKGLVQRRLDTPNGVIIESLNEFRLMPSN